MTRTRKDVWKLDEGWNDTLLWYARAVFDLQQRALADPTSWRFLAGMHGFHPNLWSAFGYLSAGETWPPDDDPLWQQCQHQTWYFLPWHRGYLLAFEAILRDAIVKRGGPDDWAIPYWNYSDASNPRALEMPTAFSDDTWPDNGSNPLKVERRYGVGGDASIVIPAEWVVLDTALQEPEYTGVGTGGSPGFGGPETAFSHSGEASGLLEDVPHNMVHVAIGGEIPGPGNPAFNNGLMSMPQTAALDPIFWIHHANIDRLWEVWLRRDPAHADPADPLWLDGPADRTFVVPKPDGSTASFAARQMLDIAAPELDYTYEDMSDPLAGVTRVASRMVALGRGPGVAAAMAGPGADGSMASKPAELMGANAGPLRLEGASVGAQVRMDPQAGARWRQSFARSLAAGGPREPDRIFLNLENIRGNNDSVTFDVYVELPAHGALLAGERRVGSVSLFGVSQASAPDAPNAGNGLTKVIEITGAVDRLGGADPAELAQLKVRFVPRRALGGDDGITVGRISVYRQGG